MINLICDCGNRQDYQFKLQQGYTMPDMKYYYDLIISCKQCSKMKNISIYDINNFTEEEINKFFNLK